MRSSGSDSGRIVLVDRPREAALDEVMQVCATMMHQGDTWERLVEHEVSIRAHDAGARLPAVQRTFAPPSVVTLGGSAP